MTHPIERLGPGWIVRMFAQRRLTERTINARLRAVGIDPHLAAPPSEYGFEGFDE